MKKILVTATIHGNEKFGLKILGALYENKSAAQTLVAHPEAVAKNVRFIESDLNRSFNGKSSSLEERIAQSIMDRVKNIKPDIVIDLHTSVSDCGAVGIVTKYSRANHLIAEKSGMSCLVIMQPSDSFIDQFDVPAVALEFGKNLRSNRLAKNIAEAIESFHLDNTLSAEPTIPVYKMESIIEKNYKGLDSIKNLAFDHVLGGYPFLAGKNTYADIGGFLLQLYDHEYDQLSQGKV